MVSTRSEPGLDGLPVPLQPLSVQTYGLAVLLDDPVRHRPRVRREEALYLLRTLGGNKSCRCYLEKRREEEEREGEGGREEERGEGGREGEERGRRERERGEGGREGEERGRRERERGEGGREEEQELQQNETLARSSSRTLMILAKRNCPWKRSFKSPHLSCKYIHTISRDLGPALDAEEISTQLS